MFNWIRNFCNKQKVVSSGYTYDSSTEIMVLTDIYADGHIKETKYKGSCTVWFRVDGFYLSRCSTPMESYLYNLWESWKYKEMLKEQNND